MRVSEICVKRIRVNQGLGYNISGNGIKHLPKQFESSNQTNEQQQ